MAVLTAILLVDPTQRTRVCGLTLAERARRVATRVGATSMIELDVGAPATWVDRLGTAHGSIVVVRAHDQLVHPPLLAAVTGERDVVVVAPSPSPQVALDLPAGAEAGALIAHAGTAAAVVEALRAGRGFAALVEVARAHDAVDVAHGPVARYPVRTPDERRAAERFLLQILVKPQDNEITRYLYRPVSLPLTKLLMRTPITPNQISYLTGLMVAVGLWLTAHASMSRAIAGTVLVLAASYVDCCDGEIARLKLLSSKFGAWLDTVIDEFSTLGYMVAIGWHCRAHFGNGFFGDPSFDAWTLAIAVATVCFFISLYGIYYNIIVMVGSANSQDYVGSFVLVEEPGGTWQLRAKAPVAIAVAPHRSAVVRAVSQYAPYIIRRDFISWLAVLLAVIHQTWFSFALLSVGMVVTAIIVGGDHLRLRRQRAEVRRRTFAVRGSAC